MADHSWHLALMAILVEPLLGEKIDLLRALKMIIVHDLVEAEVGDLPYHDGVKNSILAEEKGEEEANEIERIKQMVSEIDDDLAEEVYSLWMK